MFGEIMILTLALLFFILGIFFFRGKGAWLISGYHTLPKAQRQKYNEKKICRAAGWLSLTCCILLCITAYLAYLISCGIIAEWYMLPFALIFIVIVAAVIIAGNRYTRL